MAKRSRGKAHGRSRPTKAGPAKRRSKLATRRPKGPKGATAPKRAKPPKPQARASTARADKGPTLDDLAELDRQENGGRAAKVPDEGVQVVARGPSKFSLSDLEALKAAIKIKGTASTVEGINFDELKWDADGLIPIVAQDRRTGAVLSLGWGNRETLEASLRSKKMSYWSRARNKPLSSEEAGRPQRLASLAVDCDKDSLLATVEQDGPACHRDTGTCWTDGRAPPLASFIGELDRMVANKGKAPADEQAAKLLAQPIEALRKFVQDANETVKVLQGKSNHPLEREAAELLYHLVIVCRTKGLGLDRVVNELYARHLAEQVKKA